MPVKAKLNSLYSTLPPAERRVADFVLKNDDKAMYMTITELASAAAVSLPSVTRLAKKLGYQGFSDFKIALASGSANLVKGAAKELLDDDSDEDFVEKLMLGQLRAIESTTLTLDKEQLCSLSERIVHARRVVFFAVDNSSSVCTNICSDFIRIGLDSVIMSDPSCMLRYAARLGPEDVFFGVSRTGLTQCTLECLGIAKRKGAVTAFMSNLINSPAAEIADYFFCSSRLEEIYRFCGLETNCAQKAIMEVLSIVTARKLGKFPKEEYVRLLTE